MLRGAEVFLAPLVLKPCHELAPAALFCSLGVALPACVVPPLPYPANHRLMRLRSKSALACARTQQQRMIASISSGAILERTGEHNRPHLNSTACRPELRSRSYIIFGSVSEAWCHNAQRPSQIATCMQLQLLLITTENSSHNVKANLPDDILRTAPLLGFLPALFRPPLRWSGILTTCIWTMTCFRLPEARCWAGYMKCWRHLSRSADWAVGDRAACEACLMRLCNSSHAFTTFELMLAALWQQQIQSKPNAACCLLRLGSSTSKLGG